jgi:type II secretory pathway component PulK
MALILTLAILALLSILLVSFVSMAALDRGATQSYAKSLQADQVALGGLDVIVSQLRAEIADPALSTNSTSGTYSALYIPLAATNSVPQRMAPNLAGLTTLIGYSGTSVFTAGAGVTNYSSGSSTLNN